MNLKDLMKNFDQRVEEVEDKKRKSNVEKSSVDDIDSMIRERNETRKDTRMRGGLEAFKGFTLDSIPNEPEIDEEQVEDDFADFDNFTPTPAKPPEPVHTVPQLVKQPSLPQPAKHDQQPNKAAAHEAGEQSKGVFKDFNLLSNLAQKIKNDILPHPAAPAKVEEKKEAHHGLDDRIKRGLAALVGNVKEKAQSHSPHKNLHAQSLGSINPEQSGSHSTHHSHPTHEPEVTHKKSTGLAGMLTHALGIDKNKEDRKSTSGKGSNPSSGRESLKTQEDSKSRHPSDMSHNVLEPIKQGLASLVGGLKQETIDQETHHPLATTSLPAIVTTEPELDLDAIIASRERSTNTMSKRTMFGRAPMPVNPSFVPQDAEAQDKLNNKLVGEMVAHMNQNALNDIAKLVASAIQNDSNDDLGVFGFSSRRNNEEEEDPDDSDKFSVLSISAAEEEPEEKGPGNKTNVSASKNMRSKEAESSKMQKIFLSTPTAEFAKIAEEYHDEISKIKESTGKLTINMDVINTYSHEEKVAEIGVKELRLNFYEFFLTKYFKPKCFCSDPKGELVLLGSERGALVLWDPKISDNYQNLQLTQGGEGLTSMFYNPNCDVVTVGTSNGDVHYIKVLKQERQIKKLNVGKTGSTHPILAIRTDSNLVHTVAVDSENKVWHIRVDRTKPFDKLKIAGGQIGFGRPNVIPHIDILDHSTEFSICAITMGKEIQIYELKDNARPPQTKFINLILKTDISQDSLVSSHDDSAASASTTFPSIEVLPPPTQEKSHSNERKSSSTAEEHIAPEKEEESLPLLIDWKEDPKRSAVLLLVAKGRYLHQYELILGHNPPKAIHFNQIKLANDDPISLSMFASGYVMLMDSKTDFYLVDYSTLAREKLGGTSLRKSFIDQQNKQFRSFLLSLGVPHQDMLGESYDRDHVFHVHSYAHKDKFEGVVDPASRTESLSSFVNVLKSGDLLFLNTRSLCIFNLLDWKTYLELCFESKNYYLVLRVLNELLDGENARIRRLPHKSVMGRQLEPYIIKALQEFVPHIKLETPEEVEMLTNYCTMTLFKNGMLEFLLDGMESLMEENGLKTFYLKDLIILYKSHLLPSLDLDKIYKIVRYLEENDIMEKQRFMLYLFNRKLEREFLFNNLANRGNINLLFYLADKQDDPAKTVFPLENLKIEIDCAETPQQAQEKIFKIFWFVFEIVEKKLEKKEVHQGDPYWHILHWLFNPELVGWFVQKNLQAFLEGWFLLLDRGMSKLLSINPNLNILDGYKVVPNEIMDNRTGPELTYLFNKLYFHVCNSTKDRTYFHFFTAMLKFLKIPLIEFNETYLRELVHSLILHISDLLSDSRVVLSQEDINILIFATFTEHKELFVGNTELKELIIKNEKNLKLLFHEMNRDIQASFSLYKKLSKENVQFRFRMFQWLKKGLDIKDEKDKILTLIQAEFTFLVRLCLQRSMKILFASQI
jgi:hypothetical protein